jgi:beta-lactam-binding protein with PASTA domain
MQRQSRIRWLAHQLLLLFILVALAFLSAIATIRFTIQGREVEMPKIEGLKAGDAQALLAQRRLGFRIADRTYSALPKDAVVRQSPRAGTTVKIGQRAHVVLSLGPQNVKIPALEGQGVRAARIELLRSGLQVGEVTSVHLPESEAGLVLKQFPPPGGTAGTPRVDLLVSLGAREEAYVMPRLVGLPLAEAQRRLGEMGLRVGKVAPAPLALVPKDTVLAQTPAAGTRAVAGTAVELQVAP